MQETRSIQRTQTPPRLWPLTLSCDLDLESRLKRFMSLDVDYCIVPWYQYDVCECNSLRHMTICSFFVIFDLRLWPSSSIKIIFIFIIRWTLYFCVLVPSTKFASSINFEIWAIVLRRLKWRHNEVISHSNFMKFKHKSTKGMHISKLHTEFHFDQT